MHTINAHFRRLSESSVTSLFGEIGAYVLWDGQSKARPSYIGEGVILKRLAEHAERFSPPLDGYAASLEGSPQRVKADAEIVETLLLAVAQRTDRAPAVNVAPGKVHGIQDLFRRHGVVRVNVYDLDPFAPPDTPRRLSTAKRITVRDDGMGHATIEDDWRLRPKMVV
jgi:hypothetical protein